MALGFCLLLRSRYVALRFDGVRRFEWSRRSSALPSLSLKNWRPQSCFSEGGRFSGSWFCWTFRTGSDVVELRSVELRAFRLQWFGLFKSLAAPLDGDSSWQDVATLAQVVRLDKR